MSERPATTTLRLRVVGVNDVYSLEELPRLASLIQAARTIDAPDRLLVTVAGDFLAPSLLSSLDAGRGMVDCLNALGVTHVTLGNHEDDLETQDLFARLGELSAKVLLTNVVGFRGRHVISDVIHVGALRVGLVGVVNGDSALYHRPPFGGADVQATNESAAREAMRLRADGCVAVVALTHQRMTDDRALAELGVVDIVLGGHEHDGFLETDHRAPLAKAPMNATSAVVATLSLDASERGAVKVTTEVRLEPVAGYPEDPAMRARVDAHLEAVRVLEARTLLILPEGEVLSSVGARHKQTSFGGFVCSRLRDTLGAEAGIFNGGGLRGGTARRGRLTYADFQEELPFDNEVVVASLPGAVLRDAIRYSRTTLGGTGGFLQVDDGAQMDEQEELVTLAGAPLDPDRLYRVALVRDLLLGTDRIEPLLAFAHAHPEAVPPVTTGIDLKVALLRTLTSAAPIVNG